MTEYAADLLTPEQRLPAIGLIVLQADETLEGELHRYIPPTEANLYVSRIPSGHDVTLDSLKDMADKIEASAALFPRSIAFDAIAYCCTSGTAVIGAEQVAASVHAGCLTAAVTDPVTALIDTCTRQKVQRLALLSPYIESVSEQLRAKLSAAGIATPVFGSFHEQEEAKVARINPSSIRNAAIDLAGSGYVDAVFLSCTNLRTFEVLSDIRNKTGLPTFSSNSVLALDLARLADVSLDAPPAA